MVQYDENLPVQEDQEQLKLDGEKLRSPTYITNDMKATFSSNLDELRKEFIDEYVKIYGSDTDKFVTIYKVFEFLKMKI